ncbi:MAG TPA: recombinase family protein [Actinomycetota bacterium]|nr:recombinase family protein [Actinomycetota bacterium]
MADEDARPLRFAWYGRLSTEELQQPELAFPTQRAACERRIKGIGAIVCQFTDVQSGRSSDRAGVEALLAEGASDYRRFDAVVTYKAERFARSMYLSLHFEHELKSLGIPIYVSDEYGDPGRPTSVLTRRIKQAVGEWYVLELLEESRRGMEENTRQGFNTGGVAPYGYRKVYFPHPSKTMAERGFRKARLEPDPEQGPTVRWLFEEFVFAGRTIRQLAEELNARGVASARGRTWSPGTISGLLDNPKYTGYQVWNRRRRKTGGNRGNPQSEWVWSEEPSHEALVSREVWERAWRMRRTPERDWRRRPRGALFTGRPLKGLVLCCGRRMGATQRLRKSGKVVILWQCQQCRSWLRDDRLMELVVDVVCSELLDPLRAATLEQQLSSAFRDRQKASLKGRTRLERRLADLHEEKLPKLDGFRHGIDPALIRESIDRLSAEENRLREELAQITRNPEEQVQLASIGRLREAGPELSAALLSGPDELRRRILTRLVKSVTYLKENRDIEVVLVMPHPDVPLKLVAPDDLAAPIAPEERVRDRQCPGPGAYRIHTG